MKKMYNSQSVLEDLLYYAVGTSVAFCLHFVIPLSSIIEPKNYYILSPAGSEINSLASHHRDPGSIPKVGT